MTNEFYRALINYKPDHSTYGGEITQFDCEGHNTMVSMAAKITQASSFDKTCRQLADNRDRKISKEEK